MIDFLGVARVCIDVYVYLGSLDRFWMFWLKWTLQTADLHIQMIASA